MMGLRPGLAHDEEVGEVVRQNQIRAMGADMHRERIDGHHLLDGGQQRLHLRTGGLGPFEREHHIGRGERGAIVEFHVGAQFELPDGGIIGLFPVGGNGPLQRVVGQPDEQRLVHLVQQVEVQAHVDGMRVERGGIGRAGPADGGCLGSRQRQQRGGQQGSSKQFLDHVGPCHEGPNTVTCAAGQGAKMNLHALPAREAIISGCPVAASPCPDALE